MLGGFEISVDMTKNRFVDAVAERFFLLNLSLANGRREKKMYL